MPYEVDFVWAGPQYDKQKLKILRCDNKDIPTEETSRKQFADQYVQVMHAEMEEACLTVNSSQTLRLEKGSFLYMDVGCWLKGKQNLGLVCGNQAWIGNYSPWNKAAGCHLSSPTNILDDFLGYMPGLEQTNKKRIFDPYPKDPNRLYVILPDMHVPAGPPLGIPDPPPPPQQYEMDEPGHSHQNPEYRAYMKTYRSFFDAAARDLFASRSSIGGLVDFLDKLLQYPSAGNVTLFQLGDMYELWAGRPCYFAQTPAKYPYVDLEGTESEKKAAAREIGSWVGNTHLMFPELFRSFDKCKSAGINLRFLHGNHDNYMILSEIVTAARTYIGECLSNGSVPGVPQEWVPEVQSSNVYIRQSPRVDDNMFVEHGQRSDHFNRDGEKDGHDKTQSATHWEFLKAYDATRRGTFVTGAACKWLRRDRSFGIYVQGHTHSPVLDYVRVCHQREDSKVKYPPNYVHMEIEIKDVPLPDGVVMQTGD